MLVNTNISNVIDGNSDKSKYDTEVKKILSDKTVLAWIMKYSIREFEKYSIEEIRDLIEGEPEIATKKVLPGHTPEEITGLNTEDSVPGEGTVTYDICFYAVVPGGERIKLIINVEAQCGTEFTPKNYDDIKKVYSIWICMDVPRKMEYTITKYRMTKEDVYGCVPDDARYDLLEVVMVCLGEEENAVEGMQLHGLLNTLLSDALSPGEKKEILKQEYGIATSVEMEGGLQKMCNLSEIIEEKGIEKGTLMTLISLVKDGLLAVEDAAGRSGLSIAEFKALVEKKI